uniref:Uncharacterized protein n=1 Tax=Clastoptera arizonana TaxID=38151 RepID=A0A1B6EFM5_9HEMI
MFKILLFISVIHCVYTFYNSLPYPDLLNRIMNTLTSPAPGKGSELLLDTYNYLKFLESLSDTDSEDMKIITDVIGKKSQLFNLAPNMDLLKNIFNWDSGQLIEFKNTMAEIKVEWAKICKTFISL